MYKNEIKIKLQMLLVLVFISTLTSICQARKPISGNVPFKNRYLIIRPLRDNSMLINPGKGWVQYYGTDAYTKDIISMGYSRWCWSDIEPEEGKYNWKPIDVLIKTFKQYGKKVGLGVINVSTGIGYQYCTPKWVFDAGAIPLKLADSSSPTGFQIIPKTWDDPVFLAKMHTFIKAFGARYNGNPNIAFIDIRDYGDWGECNGDVQKDSGIQNTTLECFQNNFLLPYIKAFPNTQLIVPWTGAWFHGHPANSVYKWAVSLGVGLRRDGICSEWSKDGSECLIAYGHEPVVYEYANTWADTVKSGYASPEKLMMYVKSGKPSYIQFQPAFYETNKDFCHMLGNKMGYHFILQKAIIPTSITTGKPFSTQWTWVNDGVAPLYEPCSVAIALLDRKDNVIRKQWLPESNPNGWKPDESTTEILNATLPRTPSGNYKLAIGLFLNRKDANPTYRLGIQGRTDTGWYVISSTIYVR